MASPEVRKFLYVLIFYGLYFNLLLYILIPIVYTELVYLTFLIIFYLVGILDTVFRPVTDRDREVDKYSGIIFIFWLVHPFIFTLLFYENLFITLVYFNLLDNVLVSWTGIIIYSIGGVIAIAGRVQLGRFGSGRLLIQEEHSLVTSGLYKYVRNPMYTGGFIGTIAFGLIFRSIFTTIFALILYLAIFRQRWLREEKLLEQEFGEVYSEYKKRTKRLIPGIY